MRIFTVIVSSFVFSVCLIDKTTKAYRGGSVPYSPPSRSSGSGSYRVLVYRAPAQVYRTPTFRSPPTNYVVRSPPSYRPAPVPSGNVRIRGTGGSVPRPSPGNSVPASPGNTRTRPGIPPGEHGGRPKPPREPNIITRPPLPGSVTKPPIKRPTIQCFDCNPTAIPLLPIITVVYPRPTKPPYQPYNCWNYEAATYDYRHCFNYIDIGGSGPGGAPKTRAPKQLRLPKEPVQKPGTSPNILPSDRKTTAKAAETPVKMNTPGSIKEMNELIRTRPKDAQKILSRVSAKDLASLIAEGSRQRKDGRTIVSASG